MPPLRSVLLLHETPEGSHHDWMFEHPDPALAGPDQRLWTARVALPSHAWARAGRLELTELPPHRRAYLTYEGEVSGNRGRVRQIDAGHVTTELWTPDRTILTVALRHFHGRLELRRLAPGRLIATPIAQG